MYFVAFGVWWGSEKQEVVKEDVKNEVDPQMI